MGNELFGAEWRVMWGMRNRIAHGYLGVDLGILQQTLQADLPDLIATLRAARRSLPGEQ